MRYLARVGTREWRIEIERRDAGRFAVTLDGDRREVERRGDGAFVVLGLPEKMREAVVVRESGRGNGDGGAETPYGVVLGGRHYAVRLLDPLKRSAVARPAREGPVDVRAIMPGRIRAILVPEGETVRNGQGVVVVEAMKMENEIPAPKDGRVSRVRVRPGDTVEAGAALFTVE
ncbi:MAG TPA: biotin/lipoyl-containing protein [Candidatus Binatia bacterium]|nr:biotin/lipoyl-containing protein [Candidatus Binatia bacterium]